jgi:hypothetical protein
LKGDQFGKTPRFVFRDNLFDQCTKPIGEGVAGAWEAAIKSGNLFGDKAAPYIGLKKKQNHGR